MKRYELAKDLFFKEMLSKSSGFYLRVGLQHCLNVSAFAILIAKKRRLDEELIGIAGLFHDIHTYTKMNSFNHAYYSSIQAKELLESLNLVTTEELDIIITAIKNHSNKKITHDNYSECLKDADVLDHYMWGTLREDENNRIRKLKLETFC